MKMYVETNKINMDVGMDMHTYSVYYTVMCVDISMHGDHKICLVIHTLDEGFPALDCHRMIF